MDFLYVTGGQAHNRHRLSPWVLQAGYGRHIPAKRGKVRHPFDVISPSGREWIEERWSATLALLDAQSTRTVIGQAREALASFQAGRLVALNTQGCALWLSHHFGDLSHVEIGGILDVSQQVVSRYLKLHSTQRKAALLRRGQSAPDLGRVKTLLSHDEWSYASGGARYITQAHNLPGNEPRTSCGTPTPPHELQAAQ
jgi:hypothetical protein